MSAETIAKFRKRIKKKFKDAHSAFVAFDEDKDGKINRQEFKVAFKTLKMEVPDDERTRFRKLMDPKDKGISEKVFCKLVEAPTTPSHHKNSRSKSHSHRKVSSGSQKAHPELKKHVKVRVQNGVCKVNCGDGTAYAGVKGRKCKKGHELTGKFIVV